MMGSRDSQTYQGYTSPRMIWASTTDSTGSADFTCGGKQQAAYGKRQAAAVSRGGHWQQGEERLT